MAARSGPCCERGSARERQRWTSTSSLRPGGRDRGIGWVVPKLGNAVVARNRLKRRLREIGRTRVLGALRAKGVGADVLVRVRTSAYRATYRQLEEELMSVVDGKW